MAIGPARSADVGALCIDPGPVEAAVRIGDESVMSAIEAAELDLDPA